MDNTVCLAEIFHASAMLPARRWFAGASFDPRDGRVHIMCGARVGDGHLTRSITGVTAIQLLKDVTGKDAFLRDAHGRGQTLLTLER